MESGLGLLDHFHQPCLVVEASQLHLRFVNRAFAIAIGQSPRKLLRNFKRVKDIFPVNEKIFHQGVVEISQLGGEINSEEIVEDILGTRFVFTCRFVKYSENTILILLNNLTVERKLQEKYGILQRSLTAYAQRMKSDLEFKDFIVERLPKLITLELAEITKTLLEMKEDAARRKDLSSSQRVKLVASSVDQLSYISKNISQLRAPHRIERKTLSLGDLAEKLQTFFKKSFDPQMSQVVVKWSKLQGSAATIQDVQLLSFCLRNLFAFLMNKAAEVDKACTLQLKITESQGRNLLDISGTVETTVGKSRGTVSGRDLGLELLVAHRLTKAMGGQLSFAGASVLGFQLNIPLVSNFVLHSNRPVYDHVLLLGGKSSVPVGIAEFMEVENLDFKCVSLVDSIVAEEKSALLIPPGALTKAIVAKLSRLNNTSVRIIPIIRHDTYDQLLYAFEELEIQKFLIEPITSDSLRSTFFDESDGKGPVIKNKGDET